MLQRGLTQLSKKAYVTQINEYERYKNAEHLIFLTATYGEGEAPTNAKKIFNLVQSIKQPKTVNYAVVGFGSTNYPKYCQFAIDLEEQLKSIAGFSPTLPLFKINNQSFEAFQQWVAHWGKATKTALQITKDKAPIQQSFKVAQKTNCNTDQTFLIHLHPAKKQAFSSGDLWEFIPSGEETPRLYSVGKINNNLVLSIKKHELGKASSFLSSVNTNEKLKGRIIANPKFNFPEDAPQVICIANGTGIGPFLGMMAENKQQIPLSLYWGGRTKASVNLYQPYLDNALKTKQLSELQLAFSKAQDAPCYVQDVLEKQGAKIAQALEHGAVLMLCGSLAMQKGVLASLDAILKKHSNKTLSYFEDNHQLKMDCY